MSFVNLDYKLSLRSNLWKVTRKLKKKNRFISKWLIQNTNPKELYTVHPQGCPVLYHLENTECYLQPQSTKFGSASLGVGRTAGGTLGHLLARALSFSPLKAEIPRISNSWQKGWSWGGRSLAGCSTVLIRVPIFVSTRVWHSSLCRTVYTSLQTMFHLLEFGRGEVRELSAWVPLCLAIFTAPCLVSTRRSPGDWS